MQSSFELRVQKIKKKSINAKLITVIDNLILKTIYIQIYLINFINANKIFLSISTKEFQKR